MSRIGNAPITIPDGVTVEKVGREVTVSGPKGVLKIELNPTITLDMEGPIATIKRKNDF